MVFDRYVVECNYDKMVVIELTRVERGSIIHAGGKPNVLKMLEKCINCLGLIDEDPRSDQPPRLWGVKLEPAGHDIKVGKYKGNVVVVLCPELEEWVAKVARNAGIRKDVDARDLEDDEAKFKTVIRELAASNPEPEPIRLLRDIFLKGL
jgi:hypothetical protein